jgi:putative glutamine amidotransferase
MKPDRLIYVVGLEYDPDMELLFDPLGTVTGDPQDLMGADLVVFTGGEDIAPSYYGEDPHPTTCWNATRDAEEVEIFEEARFHRIPMTGICRGMQLIHILNGGKLEQDIQNHPYSLHSVVTEDGDAFTTNTIHHQAVIEDRDIMQVWARSWPDSCIEAAAYPYSHSFGVQFHPEMLAPDSPAVVWYLNKVRELIGLQSSSGLPLSAIH